MTLNMRQFKRGLGAIAASGSTQSPTCAATFNIFSSQFWNCLGANLQDQAADVYTYAEYGSLPAPTGIQPLGVPTTDSSGLVTATTPDQIATEQEQGSVQATIDAQNAAIAAAIASGQYNPSGNLPVNATQVSNYLQNPLSPNNAGISMVIVALAVAGIVLLGKKR